MSMPMNRSPEARPTIDERRPPREAASPAGSTRPISVRRSSSIASLERERLTHLAQLGPADRAVVAQQLQERRLMRVLRPDQYLPHAVPLSDSDVTWVTSSFRGR